VIIVRESDINGKTTPGEPSEMAASTNEMAAATTEASTMPSTMCERGVGRESQNAGQNQQKKVSSRWM
jgi:hypothetical protein